MKKKHNQLIGMATDSMGLGVTSMMGMGVMSKVKKSSGITDDYDISSMASTGISLANTGQLMKTGMGVVKMFPKNKKMKGW